MKIKIIDLLNKIANGEEIPKKIKFNYNIYEYKWSNAWQESCYINDDKYRLWKDVYLDRDLNEEVEIIEEDKKIKYPILHKTAPSETTGDQMPNWRNLIDCNFEYLNKTICQLIDEINNLKEKD